MRKHAARRMAPLGLPDQAKPGKPHVALVRGRWYVIDGTRGITGPSVRWCSNYLRYADYMR
jgi:hypothetical protein